MKTKLITITLVSLVAVLAMVPFFTARAYFSDTERSLFIFSTSDFSSSQHLSEPEQPNSTTTAVTLGAGMIDIAVNGQSPWAETYEFTSMTPGTWGETDIKIANIGNNPVTYKISAEWDSSSSPSSQYLFDALHVEIFDARGNLITSVDQFLKDLDTPSHFLAASGEELLKFKVKLRDDAGTEYQNLITKFNLIIIATQIIDRNALIVEFEGAPLFNEANFSPGQNVTRWVKVTNNSGQIQRIAIEAINTSELYQLGDVLNLEIKEDGVTKYNNALSKFFTTGEVYLSDLAPGSSTFYNFSISFYPEANNDFQGESLSFDILVGFQGTEGGLLPGAGGGLPSGLIIQDESIRTTGISETSVTITWLTTYMSTSQVIYAAEGEPHTLDLTDNTGTPPKYGYAHTTPEYDVSSRVTVHSVTISDLTPGTTYYYRTISYVSMSSPASGYFSDAEVSSDNTFTAGTLDFSLSSASDFSSEVEPDQSAVRMISVLNNGSLGFQYNIRADNFNGSLCDYLNLEANLDVGSPEYSGSLKDFSYNAGEFFSPEDWEFIADLTSNDFALEGATCTFDFIYSGTQIGSAGFSDIETISNTVTAGTWEVEKPPENQPPTLSELGQFDGATSIPEGWILRHPFISSFAANVSDPDGDQIQLQVELRRFEEPFTGIDDGGILTSDSVPSGWGARVPEMRDGVRPPIRLSDGKYHWRARAIDSMGNTSGWQEFGVAGNIDFEILTSQPPTAFWAAIENAPMGVLRLRSSTETTDDNNILKELPNNWVLYVKDTHNNEQKTAGYIWWEVEDKTDGTTGWMAAQSRISEILYLEYDAEAQETLQKKTERLDTKEERIPVIVNAVDTYYTNQSVNNSLYNAGGGRDGNNNFQRFISGANFEKEFVLAVAAQESGPSFDNEACASAQDGGIGIMQITSPSLRGLGSGLDNRPKRNDCNKNFGWTEGLSAYYSNAFQGVYANIKDGMRVLQEKYRERCFEETSGGLFFTCFDIRRILTIWGYNGFGDRSGSYLNKIAAKLETLSQYFSSINYSNANQFIQKLRQADRNKILALLKSPGILYIEDRDGNITGQTPAGILENIPNSLYESEAKGVAIFFPKHPYIYRVVGTGDGTYDLDIDFIDENSLHTFRAVGIPIATSTIHSFEIDWDALSRGEKGVTLQIDADGDGIFEKTVTADNELTSDKFILQTETIIDFDPDTLNLKSKGKFVTAYIELPEGYEVSQIDISSIMLNGLVPVLAKTTEIGDYDGDGRPDLMVKFDRSEVQTILNSEGEVTLTGKVFHNENYIDFKGSDAIRVIEKGGSK